MPVLRMTAPGDVKSLELEQKCAYFQKRADELAGTLMVADLRSSKLRHELEQRRRAFNLLAALHARFYDNEDTLPLYASVLASINATLNVDRSVLLERGAAGFAVVATQGYSDERARALAGSVVEVPSALLAERAPSVVTRASAPDPTEALLAAHLGFPYFVAVPIVVASEAVAVLIAGRLKEARPFLPRFDKGDVETFGAIANVVAANVERQRLAASRRETIALQATMVENQRSALNELARYNAAYARFVPKEFLERLDRPTILDVTLGDQVQAEMTIFFSDIRSFTTLSESMSPQETFNFLNSYLKRAGPIVRRHEGFIDKYIGDAIMALFPRRASDAIEASLALIEELRAYADHRRNAGYVPISVGIGIHTGLLMLGTIGEEERMETTVISDAVNLASRVENLTKHFGATLLITQATHDALEPERYLARELGAFALKGKLREATIYEVFEGDPAPVRERKRASQPCFARALALQRAGDFSAARDLFASIADAHPADVPALRLAADCELRLASSERV